MDRQGSARDFRLAAIWIGTAAGVFLAWELRLVLLVAFAAVLSAIVLRVMVHWICDWTPLKDGPALAVAILIILLVVLGTGWLFGTQITMQFGDLMQRLRAAQDALGNYLHDHGMGGGAMQKQMLTSLQGLTTQILSGGLRIAEGAVVLVIAAIYMAAQPELYRKGVALMFARDVRAEVVDGLALIGTSLRLWLLAQLLLMLVVGVLSFVACWLLGLPSPIALGLIAGITEIVPYIGPFIGGIPAVLVALPQGIHLALYTVGAYLVIHLIEGYLVAPPLERHFIRIPPALILIGILAAEVIFGPLGILVAAPLTASVFVAIKVFYVRDTLHEETDVPDHSPL